MNKKVGQEYQLFWRESADFVRLAARCDAIIVPFAAVGADDAYDVMMEADELLQTPVLGDLVKVGSCSCPCLVYSLLYSTCRIAAARLSRPLIITSGYHADLYRL